MSEVRNLLTKGSAEFASAYYIDDFPARPALSGKLMLPAAKPVTLLILWSNLDQVMVEGATRSRLSNCNAELDMT